MVKAFSFFPNPANGTVPAIVGTFFFTDGEFSFTDRLDIVLNMFLGDFQEFFPCLVFGRDLTFSVTRLQKIIRTPFHFPLIGKGLFDPFGIDRELQAFTIDDVVDCGCIFPCFVDPNFPSVSLYP